MRYKFTREQLVNNPALLIDNITTTTASDLINSFRQDITCDDPSTRMLTTRLIVANIYMGAILHYYKDRLAAGAVCTCSFEELVKEDVEVYGVTSSQQLHLHTPIDKFHLITTTDTRVQPNTTYGFKQEQRATKPPPYSPMTHSVDMLDAFLSEIVLFPIRHELLMFTDGVEQAIKPT